MWESGKIRMQKSCLTGLKNGESNYEAFPLRVLSDIVVESEGPVYAYESSHVRLAYRG